MVGKWRVSMPWGGGSGLYSKNSIITALDVCVRTEILGGLTWLLDFKHGWGHAENLGLGELKSIHVDCSG